MTAFRPSLVPAPNRLDHVVVAHERDDVAGGVADEFFRDVGLIRVDAVLGIGLPRTEDRDVAADVSVGELDLRADARDARVDLRRWEDAPARDPAGWRVDAAGQMLRGAPGCHDIEG